MQNIMSRVVQGEDLLCHREVFPHLLCGLFKLLLLVVFTDEGFYNTDAADVLLDGVV